jgi:hypothetical protein
MHLIEPHHTHDMTPWRDTVVTLIATSRFGQIRECTVCGGEQAKTVAGSATNEELKHACASGQPRWLERFQAEYLRRTGMTGADGGMSDEEVVEKYWPDDTPSEAVSQEIEKYDLVDLDKT